MNKRLRRLSTPISITVFVTAALAWNGALAGPPDDLAWRLEAEPVGSSTTDLRDVRLVSPTTYVRASHATIDGAILQATDATVFANGWRLSAATVVIDLRLDEVEITTLRTDAPPE